MRWCSNRGTDVRVSWEAQVTLSDLSAVCGPDFRGMLFEFKGKRRRGHSALSNPGEAVRDLLEVARKGPQGPVALRS